MILQKGIDILGFDCIPEEYWFHEIFWYRVWKKRWILCWVCVNIFQKLDFLQWRRVTLSQGRKYSEVSFWTLITRSIMWVNSSDAFATLMDVINKGYSGLVRECVKCAGPSRVHIDFLTICNGFSSWLVNLKETKIHSIGCGKTWKFYCEDLANVSSHTLSRMCARKGKYHHSELSNNRSYIYTGKGFSIIHVWGIWLFGILNSIVLIWILMAI